VETASLQQSSAGTWAPYPHNRKQPVSSSNTSTSPSTSTHPTIPPSHHPTIHLHLLCSGVRTPGRGNCSVDYVIRESPRSQSSPPYLLYRRNACLICRIIGNIAGSTSKNILMEHAIMIKSTQRTRC